MLYDELFIDDRFFLIKVQKYNLLEKLWLAAEMENGETKGFVLIHEPIKEIPEQREILVTLLHPNVVTYRGKVMHQKNEYQLFDLSDGCSLKHLMMNHPEGIPVELAEHILRQIISALICVRASGCHSIDIDPDIMFLEIGRAHV
jgi:serine/threonine protein kinase